MQSLPQTKFFSPLPARGLIPRSGLSGWLQKEIPKSRLLLLSAPAGYGKTTLLSGLSFVLPGYRLTWLSLHNEDNDLARFYTCLGEALAVLNPLFRDIIFTQISTSTVLTGNGPSPFSAHTLMGMLINGILDQDLPPFILVLDDLHEINNPAIFEALDYLLEHMPSQMHLTLSTRHAPPLHLNRLRARRQMVELGMENLRFNFSESRQFLTDVLHLKLTEADIHHLHQKTEGWPAGLVLLTNHLGSLSQTGQKTDFLPDLPSIDISTFNYLAEEVLSHQSAALQDFMLKTSILTDLTPEFCRGMTGCENAADLLVEIYQKNLFLNPVEAVDKNHPPIYRYHSLFVQFLRSELRKRDPQGWNNLHTRAAGVVNEPGQVITHLLAAENWEGAAEKIEIVGEQFLQNGLQSTVLGWVQSLPVEEVQKRYRLLYILGLSALLKGDLAEAGSNLEKSLQLLENKKDDRTHGQVLVRLASLAFICAEFFRCDQLINQAVPYISDLEEQIDFHMLRASLALFWQSNWEQATSDLHRALEWVESSDNPRLWFLFSIYLAPEFTVLPGMLDLLEKFCRKAQERYGSQITPLRLGVEDTWANIHLRRGRLQQAIDTASDTLMVKDQLGGYPFLGLNACLCAAAAYSGLGNLTAAEGLLQRASQQIQEADLNQALTGGLFYPRGRLLLMQGHCREAQQVLLEMSAFKNRLPLMEVLQLMLSGRIELFNHHYPQAELYLIDAVRLQSREWVSAIYGSARLLLAYLYFAWKRHQEAFIELDYLVNECEEKGCPGLILMDMPLAAPILRLSIKKGVQASRAAALLEQAGLTLDDPKETSALLTMRQLEILKLMANGFSNQAIAEKLVLSLATVKSHGVHILDRLGVSSRMEAVARARELGLLS